jgi:hypothetical protein
MIFANETRFPARLFRTVVDDDRMMASVVARVTCDIDGGELVPSSEQPWIVSDQPWDSPHGKFDGDQVFRKGGVDLFVFGTTHAPKGKPVPSFRVRVSVGDDYVREAVVFGERRWQRDPHTGGLVASPPQPITTLRLSLEHAYGGTSEYDGLKIAHPENPAGKGFYLEEEQALGAQLAQIEDPAHPITKWNDQPTPVGFGFSPPGPRARAALEVDDKGRLKKFTHRLFNVAFPENVLVGVKPGARVRLEGFAPDGPLELTLPASVLRVRLRLGDTEHDRAPALEQVGIDVGARKCFLGFRYPFRYVVHAQQPRVCTLRGGG